MKSEKFLQFNGKNIFFQSYDGQFWIAIKPICEVLGVDYSRQLRTLKSDENLGQLWSLQTMVGADKKLREMVSLPEKYVYGWIFSLQSQSKELRDYKMECYDILFNYFHGTITNRKKILEKKVSVESRILEAKHELLKSEAYVKVQELQKTNREIGKALKKNDQTVMEEISFTYEKN